MDRPPGVFLGRTPESARSTPDASGIAIAIAAVVALIRSHVRPARVANSDFPSRSTRRWRCFYWGLRMAGKGRSLRGPSGGASAFSPKLFF